MLPIYLFNIINMSSLNIDILYRMYIVIIKFTIINTQGCSILPALFSNHVNLTYCLLGIGLG